MTLSVYLDHNAGSPARPEVVAAMVDALTLQSGNPSSVHAHGRRARALMEQSRATIAASVGAVPDAVVFTSGGTEANALALRGSGRRVLVSAIEHPSVRDCGLDRESIDANLIPVTPAGVVDLDGLDRLLAADPAPALVSVMLANNETGIVQPVADVARIAHARGALVHCDAAQGLGRLPVFLSHLNVDFLTLSAHKMGGPSGIGCLVLAKSDISLAPILLGGGQEKRRRAGTENVAGIAGFAMAARLAAAEVEAGVIPARMRDLRDGLEARLAERMPEVLVVGRNLPRLCNTSCLILPDVLSQVQVMALDLAGVMVSAGSACSSGKVAASPVLGAMGLGPGLADCALRISLGPDTTPQDLDVFLSAWCDFARRKGKLVKDAA